MSAIVLIVLIIPQRLSHPTFSLPRYMPTICAHMPLFGVLQKAVGMLTVGMRFRVLDRNGFWLKLKIPNSSKTGCTDQKFIIY